MHIELSKIDLDEVINADRIQPTLSFRLLMRLCVIIGLITFGIGIFSSSAPIVWGTFYVSTVFFTGLACGSVMIAVIFQIVRARWPGPLRRLVEANVAFLPIAFTAFLVTYFGKEYLFPWARGPMHGREWWMQPNLVYVRNGLVLGFLFWMLWRFVKLSLRADIGLIRERAKRKSNWTGWFYDFLVKGWKGSENEILAINRKLSFRGPLVVLVYAVTYTLFGFEMVIGMDPHWNSNLFGAFLFMTNIYMGWAVLTLSAVYHASRSEEFRKALHTQQFWDLGKLTFGFCMIWGYFFFSQFLPQWYGNLPEETQWMILRTREFPWKGLGWATFAMCFVFPFIVLLGRDIKKAPHAIATVALVIFLGVWTDRYVIMMPNISPEVIPFGVYDVLIFLGFLGMYVLSIMNFMARFPMIAVAHPLTHNSTKW